MSNAMPKVKGYPVCSSCLTPYILRLVFIVLPKAGQEWLWQRDCKHKSARPTTNAAIESTRIGKPLRRERLATSKVNAAEHAEEHLAPPSAPPATDANGVWIPPDLYKTACALDALIHSTPDMSGDLRDVRLTGGHKKISDALRAFKWALTEPPAPSVNEDRMLLLKALFEGTAEIRDEHGEQALVVWIPTRIGRCGSEFQIPSLDETFTDDLRAALIRATEANHG